MEMPFRYVSRDPCVKLLQIHGHSVVVCGA